MPTFDFQCTGCNHIFEFNRPFGSKEIPQCPECDEKDVNKLISTPNIQFKGDGFYKTDSQKKPAKPAKKEEKKKEEKKETKPKASKEQKDSKKEAK